MSTSRHLALMKLQSKSPCSKTSGACPSELVTSWYIRNEIENLYDHVFVPSEIKTKIAIFGNSIGEIHLLKWIDCQDIHGRWRIAQIIDILCKWEIKVHIYGTNDKNDRWINVKDDPDEIAPLHTYTKIPFVNDPLTSYDIGTECEVLGNRGTLRAWADAEIIDVDKDRNMIQVEYHMYNVPHKEWLTKNSYRIARK